jgi:hypothetical protein
VDWFDKRRRSRCVLAHMPHRGCVSRAFTRDCHPGLKRLLCLMCFRVLPLQPYDTMGSVLIEYDVRVQPWVLAEGGSRIVGVRSGSFG